MLQYITKRATYGNKQRRTMQLKSLRKYTQTYIHFMKVLSAVPSRVLSVSGSIAPVSQPVNNQAADFRPNFIECRGVVTSAAKGSVETFGMSAKIPKGSLGTVWMCIYFLCMMSCLLYPEWGILSLS